MIIIWVYILLVFINTCSLFIKYIICYDLLSDEIDTRFIPSGYKEFYNYYISIGYNQKRALIKAANFRFWFGILPMVGLIIGIARWIGEKII